MKINGYTKFVLLCIAIFLGVIVLDALFNWMSARNRESELKRIGENSQSNKSIEDKIAYFNARSAKVPVSPSLEISSFTSFAVASYPSVISVVPILGFGGVSLDYTLLETSRGRRGSHQQG
jgi:hypothetical protein